MKGSDVSLKHLQRALTMELTTVNTYILQERKLDDWGVDRLAKRMREEIDEEREHANLFLTRLLFLEGKPDVHTLDKIDQPKDIAHIFKTQASMEQEAIEYYNKAAQECQEAGDIGSFNLFMTILGDEEEHVGFVEEQQDLMEMLGTQLYLARQVSSVAAEEEDD
ncbi:bacterioferritin [Rhodopseudomonas julia]|uniref:Bacterioferritin n=1 Tax=Rhodopseudomonas julia TaxID=200617 RepID=A0ABU0CAH5_9BRAD|nr:ferritin-like domain-containing protein [Rhodopseudomonas julia]MDQ0327536.1 bacterioferritin [Rhodopseudomonas julia]